MHTRAAVYVCQLLTLIYNYNYLHVLTMAFISCRLELRFIFAGFVDPDLQFLLTPSFDNSLDIVQTGAAVYICRLETLIYNYYYLHVLTMAFISCRLELRFMIASCRPWSMYDYYYLHVLTMAFISCRLELKFIFAGCRPWSMYDYYYLHVLTMAFISCRLELRFMFAGCRPWFTIIITSKFWRWPSHRADWSCGLCLPVVDPDLQLLLPPCFDDGLHIVQTGAAVYICRL